MTMTVMLKSTRFLMILTIPIGHVVNCKESYETMYTLTNLIKYKERQCKMCGDLKVIGLLKGLQGGYTKYSAFLCLWDSIARQHHYFKKRMAYSEGVYSGQNEKQTRFVGRSKRHYRLYTSNWNL